MQPTAESFDRQKMPETNPYRTPEDDLTSPASFPSWALMSDAGMMLQGIVLAVYMYISVDSNKPPSELLKGIPTTIHTAMATCAGIGVVVCILSTMNRGKWSAYVRIAFIGLAILVFSLTCYASHMFGTFRFATAT